jgi:hypothetical protein
VIATGAYDATDARYEIPAIDADFTATGAGYSYDRIIIYIDERYLHPLDDRRRPQTSPSPPAKPRPTA